MAATLLCWSGGKDCAWALAALREAGHQVSALVTTVDRDSGCVGMHGVHGSLIEAQAAAAGLPLWSIPLSWPSPNEEYDAAMRGVHARALACGIDHVAFGDLHLEDVRAYREARLRGSGMTPLFPLWGLDPHRLAMQMCAAGLRARVVCVELARMARGAVGREYSEEFVRTLPAGIDPCGENGEFHTFVWDGPMFRQPVPVTVAGTHERDGFLFADLRMA